MTLRHFGQIFKRQDSRAYGTMVAFIKKNKQSNLQISAVYFSLTFCFEYLHKVTHMQIHFFEHI